jgi:hypothetical protein
MGFPLCTLLAMKAFTIDFGDGLKSTSMEPL